MQQASVGFQCPECVAEGRRTQRRPLTAFGGGAVGQQGYATKALIGVNVLVMVFAVLSGGGGALAGGGWGGLMGGVTPLAERFAVLGLAPYSPLDPTLHGVAAGEWYRLVTAMFVHYGLLHLLLNMYALWILGRNLESALGPARFLALYLISGIGGNVAAYVFAPNTLSAGASTAVFGLFAGIFVLLRRLGRSTSALVPVIVVNVVFTLAVPGISIAGHFGGLVTGAAVAAVLAYAPQARRTLVQTLGCGAILAVLALITAYQTAQLT
jgi:membrane associated rhomboid family serine protease